MGAWHSQNFGTSPVALKEKLAPTFSNFYRKPYFVGPILATNLTGLALALAWVPWVPGIHRILEHRLWHS